MTANRLDIKNPHRIAGLILLVSGCVLGVLLLARVPRLLEEVRAVGDALRARGSAVADSVGGVAWVLCVAVSALFALVAAVYALVGVIVGLKKLLYFFVPAGAPGPLQDASGALRTLFRDRTITTYSQPSTSLSVAASVFSGRLRYTLFEQRAIAEQLVKSVPLWVVLLVLLSVPRFVPAGLGGGPAGANPLASVVGSNWPLPIFVGVVGALVIVVRAFATIAGIPRVPGVQVYEGREHIATSGDPVNFYNHVQKALVQLRHGNFPNRSYVDAPPAIGRSARGDVGQFDSTILFETQPLPAGAGMAAPAAVLDLGGACLRCIGLAVLMFPGLLGAIQPTASGLVGFSLQALAGLLALVYGSKFARVGARLHHAVRFESDVFWLSLTGTYTVSNVGIGDGRGGLLYSERAMVQSDTHIHIYGTRVVSLPSLSGEGAAEPLLAPRVIVDSLDAAGFRERVDALRRAMLSFEDTGGRLPEIDLSARGVQGVVGANIEIARMTAGGPAALPAGHGAPRRLPGVFAAAPPPSEPAPPPAHTTDELKVCPACVKPVESSALYCPGCGHAFRRPAGGPPQMPGGPSS